MITDWTLFNLHKHQRDEESRRRYTRPAPDSNHNRSLAHLVERDVAAHIWQMGYSAHWMPHNARFDLLVDGCLRVEVKAATWTLPGTVAQPGRRDCFLLRQRPLSLFRHSGQ